MTTRIRSLGSAAVGAWLVACALLPPAHAAGTPALRYAKPIHAPQLAAEELLAISLDDDVYAATQDGLADLRILDAAGRETPYVLRTANATRQEKQRKTWSPADPRVELLGDQGLQITLTLAEDDPAPLGMRLITPVKDFERRVTVFASPDGESWQPLLEDGLVFDYSRFIDVRNDALEFPAETNAGSDGRRHLRIVIDDVTREQQSQLMELTRRLEGDEETSRSERVVVRREPFRIDRIELWGDERQQRVTGTRTTQFVVDVEPAPVDAASHQTIVLVGARRRPITSLGVQTPDRNFSRPARVEALRSRGGSSVWESLGAATISRIDFRDLQRESLDIALPEAREEQLRIVIENGDNAPLAISGVEATGPVYELVFLASPAAKYRLAYGNASLGPPRYDTATIAESLAADYRPAATTLGDQAVFSTAAPDDGEPGLAKLLNSPLFLTTAIAALAIVLALGLYRAARRTAELPE